MPTLFGELTIIWLNITYFSDFDQKLVIDHHEYGGPGDEQEAEERSDEDIQYTYPEDVQLVPNVPVSPQSPKYALVPVKRLTTVPSFIDGQDEGPTIPSDFQHEIAAIHIPHTGLPGFITDPPPLKEEDEDEHEDGEEDNENEEEPDNDHFFTDEFLEPPEFKDVPTSTGAPPITIAPLEVQPIVGPELHQPLVVTKILPVYDANDNFAFNYDENSVPDDYRQIRTQVNHIRQFSHAQSPPQPFYPRFRTPIRHYGPPQVVNRYKPVPVRNSYPMYIRPQRPQIQRPSGTRVYVRYPRNYRTYYRPPIPIPLPQPPPPPPPRYNMVKVMTQNFVQHPRNRYPPVNPMMMSSMEYRSKKPREKGKKKKKKSKGECKPKRIIQEIHYHHYDPKLSAQLAPLEGINFKGDGYEHEVKVINKESEVEETVDKGHNDYEDHNVDLEKEMDKHKEETEHRLTHPEYYPDSYNPHYSESGSGSTEYIDYNIQTDSHSNIREPHPAHEYPDNERAFRKLQGSPSRSSNTTLGLNTPGNGGRYVKHQVINYYYKTPNDKNER